MKISAISIDNFRSISHLELGTSSTNFLTFVGPNSVGKSNILRAVNLFFTRQVEPERPFDPSTDLLQGSKKAARVALTLKFEPKRDSPITKFLDKTYPDEFQEHTVRMTASAYSNANVTYTFTTGKGQKKTLPDLAERILEYVHCTYVPAIKDYRAVLNTQMMRKIVAATFQGWGKGLVGSKNIGEQKDKFEKILSDLQNVLDGSATFVTTSLQEALPTVAQFQFSLPYGNLEDFLGKLLFQITESDLADAITLETVGSGIQGFTIYTMMRLLHEIRPKNTFRGSQYVWLIEEPETFMHHDLQRKTFDRLRTYAQDGPILITTHSPVFIDKNLFDNTWSVTRSNAVTKIERVTTKNVMAVIGGQLGVSLSDFLMFKRFNVLVEGETDRALLLALNEMFAQKGSRPLDAERIGFITCGSVTAIPHFYHLYNAFNQYADFAAIFDRDKAGIETRDNLIKQGAAKSRMLLLPEVAELPKTEIEDLVTRDIWEQILGELDQEGLVTLHYKQQKIVGYDYEHRNRVAFKVGFKDRLLQRAKKDLGPFEQYRVLLESIAALFP